MVAHAKEKGFVDLSILWSEISKKEWVRSRENFDDILWGQNRVLTETAFDQHWYSYDRHNNYPLDSAVSNLSSVSEFLVYQVLRLLIFFATT